MSSVPSPEQACLASSTIPKDGSCDGTPPLPRNGRHAAGRPAPPPPPRHPLRRAGPPARPTSPSAPSRHTTPPASPASSVVSRPAALLRAGAPGRRIGSSQ
eukprot:1954234-Pleurochrysis_carterae.AAC.1